MAQVYGYEIILHTPTYHNGRFIGNIPDYMTVHAHSRTHALSMVELDEESTIKVNDDLTIHKDKQTIYSVRYLGKVVTRMIYEYEMDGEE